MRLLEVSAGNRKEEPSDASTLRGYGLEPAQTEQSEWARGMPLSVLPRGAPRMPPGGGAFDRERAEAVAQGLADLLHAEAQVWRGKEALLLGDSSLSDVEQELPEGALRHDEILYALSAVARSSVVGADGERESLRGVLQGLVSFPASGGLVAPAPGLRFEGSSSSAGGKAPMTLHGALVARGLGGGEERHLDWLVEQLAAARAQGREQGIDACVLVAAARVAIEAGDWVLAKRVLEMLALMAEPGAMHGGG